MKIFLTEHLKMEEITDGQSKVSISVPGMLGEGGQIQLHFVKPGHTSKLLAMVLRII